MEAREQAGAEPELVRGGCAARGLANEAFSVVLTVSAGLFRGQSVPVLGMILECNNGDERSAVTAFVFAQADPEVRSESPRLTCPRKRGMWSVNRAARSV